MFLRNCWYVAGWSHEVEGKTLLSRKLLGEQIVFFRKESGDVAALIDRCSHRFAPLSMGRREGDGLRCMYHGLIFDGAGACILEPGRNRPSPGTNVRSYPVFKRYKFIWIWMGNPELADPALIPDCHWQDSPEWASIPEYIHYKADYRQIMDNLLDFSHLTFVHENTLGGSSTIAETKPKIEIVGQKTVRITRWYKNEPELAPYLRGVAEIEGPVDRWNIYDLFVPGNVFNMDSGSAPAGTGAPEGDRSKALQFHATQIVTPEDEKNSHFFWSYGHNFNLNDTRLSERLSARVLEGFEEDRNFIEAQQNVIDNHPNDQMAYIFVDAGLSHGRRVLSALQAEEAARKSELA